MLKPDSNNMIETLVTASVLCNLQNLHMPPCNAPVESFEVVDGEFYGELESGIPFSQTNVVNDVTRLQRFQLQDAYWYVSDKGVLYAQDDLSALSMYLAQ